MYVWWVHVYLINKGIWSHEVVFVWALYCALSRSEIIGKCIWRLCFCFIYLWSCLRLIASIWSALETIDFHHVIRFIIHFKSPRVNLKFYMQTAYFYFTRVLQFAFLFLRGCVQHDIHMAHCALLWLAGVRCVGGRLLGPLTNHGAAVRDVICCWAWLKRHWKWGIVGVEVRSIKTGKWQKRHFQSLNVTQITRIVQWLLIQLNAN